MQEKIEILAAQLPSIDQVTLTPLVRSALDRDSVDLADWECQRLHGGIGAGTAVYRFSGQGRDGGRTIPWSLILKTVRSDSGSTDPSAWNYYKREVDVYQSRWVDDLPGGLQAPRCIGVRDGPDGACWMWLEDVQDLFPSEWPLERYGVVARHLGQFNGAYLVDRPLPGGPWLSNDWLRLYVEGSAPAIEPLREARALPWGRRWLPEQESDQFFRLWGDRERYLSALDRLPQTVCHLDIFRRNLFALKTADGDDRTVAIDWAYVGRGPIGADLNPLVWFSVAIGEVGLDKMEELEEVALENYLEGLREVGWRGDPQQVRLGYTAAGLRYVFGEVGRWLDLILDESLHAGAEQMLGMPMGEAFDSLAVTRRPFVRKLGEARDLMRILE